MYISFFFFNSEDEKMAKIANFSMSTCVVQARGGDLISIMPVCVCPKVKEMGSFSALSE